MTPGDGFDEQAVVRIARHLVVERGYAGLDVDEVASRAGVDPAAIYRTWSSKADLAVHATVEHFDNAVGGIDTGDVRADLVVYVSRFVHVLRDTYGPANVDLVTQYVASQGATRAFAMLRGILTGAMMRILDRAVRRGEIRPDAPFDLIAEIVRAVVIYRLVFTRSPVPEGFAETLVDGVLLPALRGPGGSPA